MQRTILQDRSGISGFSWRQSPPARPPGRAGVTSRPQLQIPSSDVEGMPRVRLAQSLEDRPRALLAGNPPSLDEATVLPLRTGYH